jgi:hypothetical protein
VSNPHYSGNRIANLMYSLLRPGKERVNNRSDGSGEPVVECLLVTTKVERCALPKVLNDRRVAVGVDPCDCGDPGDEINVQTADSEVRLKPVA